VLTAKILGHTSDVSQSSLEQAGEAVLMRRRARAVK
jgi:hypothetical protein